jgi:hypothetical protein
MSPRLRGIAPGIAIGLVVVALAFGLFLGRGRIGRVTSAIWAPSPTATPGWVGKIQEEATPMSTFQSRVGATDPRSGRPITSGVALRDAPGRGAEPTGFSVQPGERVFAVGVEKVGSERFFKVRSFDGLKRGWLAEADLVPDERPPA